MKTSALSIRKKLLLSSMVSSAAALVLAGLALIVFDLISTREHLRQQLAVLAVLIADRSTAALVFRDRELAAENLAATSDQTSIVAACIYDASPGGDPPGGDLPDGVPANGGADVLYATFRRSETVAGCPPRPPADGSRFEDGALLVVRPIHLEEERIGTVFLRSDLRILDERMRRYAGVVVGVVAIAASVAFLFSSRLQRIVTDPIERLAAAARAVSERRDYSLRASKGNDDELGVLVDAFNDMLGTIEERDRALLEANGRLESAIGELESKNAELERFTYTVSHDLKSPLITITGFLGLLEQDARKGDLERLERDVERIRAAAGRMSRLLDELLELSRIGRLRNAPEEVPLGELAREATSLLATAIEKAGVEVEIAPDLPAVRGDRPRLLEVVQNLVENAVKFMGSQPRPRIEIGAREEGGETVFHVRDNGTGIAPAYHEKVFGLFERLDPHTDGTGIGLAIVRRVVEVHGGRIWVESEGLGRGTTFRFTLPGEERLPKPASEPVENNLDRGEESV
jgi:signal transduction histidine kinase